MRFFFCMAIQCPDIMYFELQGKFFIHVEANFVYVIQKKKIPLYGNIMQMQTNVFLISNVLLES